MKVTLHELQPRNWFVFENNLHGRIVKTLHYVVFINYREHKNQIHTIYYDNPKDFLDHNMRHTTFSYGDNVNLFLLNSPHDFFRN